MQLVPMEISCHIICGPQSLSNNAVHAMMRGQCRPRTRFSPSCVPMLAQSGGGFHNKEKWKQAWSDGSLKASPGLRKPCGRRQPAFELNGLKKAWSPGNRSKMRNRVSIICHSLRLDDVKPVSPKSFLIPKTADEEKEESMQYRRTVFDQNDWLRHRSSSRHYRHVLSIASSRVISALGPPVLVLTGVAFVVAAYNETVLSGTLPAIFPELKASSVPFQLTAPALALLLVFRTNASYSRFLDVQLNSSTQFNSTLCPVDV
jgi:hypothetical protein